MLAIKELMSILLNQQMFTQFKYYKTECYRSNDNFNLCVIVQCTVFKKLKKWT